MKTLAWLCLFAALFFSVFLGGCAGPSVAGDIPPKPSITATPTELKPVASDLNKIIVISIVVVGIGVGTFFLLPTHTVSFSLIAVGGGVEASALLARVSLWLVPWAAGALVVAGIGYLVYEIIKNRATIEADLGVSALEAGAENIGTNVASAVAAEAPKVWTGMEALASDLKAKGEAALKAVEAKL